MPRRRGFSLVEVLVALTIVGMAGAALLLATQVAMNSTDDALDEAIAQGIAQQLVEECLGLPYNEQGVSPFHPVLTRDVGETTIPLARQLFDDTDDFNAYASSSLLDPWGVEVGLGDDAGSTRHANFQLRSDFFDNWIVAVNVRYVDENDLSQDLPVGDTSEFRSVDVRVARIQPNGSVRWLTALRRVYGYVPPPS